MNIKIKETGEAKQLQYRNWETGVDWTAEFIGNNSADLTYDEEGILVLTREDYEWWAQRISAEEELVEMLIMYRERFGQDVVDRAIDHALEVNFDELPKAVKFALENEFWAHK